MDGLLGIGAAGGKTGSNANEGAMLASRLATMRKERGQRAKVVEKMPVAAAVAPPQPDGSKRAGKNKSKKKKNKKKKSKK